MGVSDSIIKTTAFFNLFNHPLTNFELYKWLYCSEPAPLSEVIKASRPKAREIIRQDRALVNDRKIRLAQKAARLISRVPFVRLAAVCNTLGFEAAEEGSDIDFFIIAKAGRIWTVRFLVTAILSLFGRRRHGRKIKDRVCLSFYLADDNLNLQSIALPVWTPPLSPPSQGGDNHPLPPPRRLVGASSSQGGDSNCLPLTKGENKRGLPDIYLVYWITQLIPLINRGQTLEKFWQANVWVKKYLANFSFESQLPDERQIKVASWVDGWRRLHERATNGRLGDWREGALRWLQLKKMSSRLRKRSANGLTDVIISDRILKFHEEDRREEYRRRWEERCLEI